MQLLNKQHNYKYWNNHFHPIQILTKSCLMSLKSLPYLSRASSNRLASEADHSSISSRHRTGPEDGTRLEMDLEQSYLCLWSVSMAWNRVMSLEAAAALIWRLGWRTVLVQSRARANVPTERAITRNWSICLSVVLLRSGLQTSCSRLKRSRPSLSPTPTEQIGINYCEWKGAWFSV